MQTTWFSALALVMTIKVIRGQQSLSDFTTSYDMFGHRMAVCSNEVAVIAQNEFRQFVIQYYVFEPDIYLQWSVYYMSYNRTDDFVQSTAFINQQLPLLVYTGESLNRTTRFIGIIDVNGGTELDRQQLNATYYINEYYQYCLGVDQQGQFAYVLGNDYWYTYDLNTYNLTSYPSYTLARCLRPVNVVMLIDSIHALVVGYSCGFTSVSYFRSISLLFLQPTNSIYLIHNETILPNAPEVGVEAFTYSPLNDLSVAVNDLGRVLVGVPMYNIVVFYSVDNDNLTLDGNNITWSAGKKMTILFISINSTCFALKREGSAFGKSVAWLDNTTFAVLAYSASGAPWASSQLLVFDVSSQWPKFSFPNNQQPIGGLSVKSPSFLRLSTTDSGGLAILLNSGDVLALASTPPGIHTTCVIDPMISKRSFYTCNFAECPSGTYKQSPSIGNCYVCPPGTKNPKNSNVTDIECEPCAPDAYCPLAAVDDVASDPYTLRITQALAYPESPDSTIFDDILIQNMFSLQISSLHCILVSPIFWTLITAGFAAFILIVAGVFQMFPGLRRHYFLIKRIFKQTDLIGEGELWIGGLFSFSIVVLVSFAYAFSNNYLSLYPIEQASNAQLACDTTMRNAKFSTGVRLLSIPVAEEEAPMFDLLDTQPFTLSIDFLNTVPTCDNILVVQTSGVNEIPVERYTCTNKTSAIVTISFQLPTHELTISVTNSKSYSIGGLRFCLTGPELVEEKGYALRSLDFCEFLGTQNQTLSYTPEIVVLLTKVINKTQPLVSSGQAQYSGLFIPKIVNKGLSERARYAQLGDYLRYLPTQSLITIDLSETQFYLKNTQEPIARKAEVVFHTLLFTIVVLELFGLVFLLFELGIAPLCRLVVSRYFNNNRVDVITVDDESLEQEKNVTVMKPRLQASEQASTQVRSTNPLTLKSVW